MHEILFRGKRTDNGEWITGMLARYNPKFDTTLIIDEFEILVMVDPETVGQYIGLTDKNGTKIFEGDIIENCDFNAEEGGYGVVEYNDGAFELNGNNISATFHENYWSSSCEVIGNIHDNPELLKGGEDDA